MCEDERSELLRAHSKEISGNGRDQVIFLQQMKKLKQKKVKLLAQGPTANKQENQRQGRRLFMWRCGTVHALLF